MNEHRLRRRAKSGEKAGGHTDAVLTEASSVLAMGILMQTFGHASAMLLEGAVQHQARSMASTESSAGLNRLNLYGVAPAVLLEAANRLALLGLVNALPTVARTLRQARDEKEEQPAGTAAGELTGPGASGKKSPSGSQTISLYRLELEPGRLPDNTRFLRVDSGKSASRKHQQPGT